MKMDYVRRANTFCMNRGFLCGVFFSRYTQMAISRQMGLTMVVLVYLSQEAYIEVSGQKKVLATHEQ